jgi:cell filamentation protein, protein adenylyltransferase
MDIKQSTAGKVINSPKGYRAFLPNPLPPAIDWNNQLRECLTRAENGLEKLAHESRKLPKPHFLTRLFVSREAVLSSKIEGIVVTIGEVLAQTAGLSVQQNFEDLQEVQNYILANDFGLTRLGELPLSLRLIKEMHEQLMQGVRGSYATPGQFRKVQNWIGYSGCSLNTAKFVPPPAEHLMDCLGEFEKFLHDRQLPALIHVALCHYQFEAIHPFLDGNGRMGRLLIVLLLIEQKILPSPLLCLSAFFEATRDEYYRQLFSVSRSGSWHEWLIYFLNGVAFQSEDAISRMERINDLLSNWKDRVASEASHVCVDIVTHFAENPYLTVKDIAEKNDADSSAVQRSVSKLEAENIIQQVSGNGGDKVYCATEILSILEEPAKSYADLDDE